MNDKLLDRLNIPTLHAVVKTGDESIIQTTRLDQDDAPGYTRYESEDDEIELLIDEVVDRHITALRQDIRALLERARDLP
ncbi:MAG: hypothetical protein KTR33_14775 [Gammaproteobacteria bacterium]|nr:hypothetical protein [Gammaproteobacteria bacterium]